MSSRNSLLVTVIGSIVAFVLQVALAPNLTIAGAAAEVSLCFVVANALRAPQGTATLGAFLLGMAIDLACGTPLGVKALGFTLVAFGLSQLASLTVLESTAVRYVAMVLVVMVGSLIIALLLSIIGVDNDVAYTLLTRALPGGLYNAVVCLLFLPLVRVGTGRSQSMSGRSGRSLKDTLPL